MSSDEGSLFDKGGSAVFSLNLIAEEAEDKEDEIRRQQEIHELWSKQLSPADLLDDSSSIDDDLSDEPEISDRPVDISGRLPMKIKLINGQEFHTSPEPYDLSNQDVDNVPARFDTDDLLKLEDELNSVTAPVSYAAVQTPSPKRSADIISNDSSPHLSHRPAPQPSVHPLKPVNDVSNISELEKPPSIAPVEQISDKETSICSVDYESFRVNTNGDVIMFNDIEKIHSSGFNGTQAAPVTQISEDLATTIALSQAKPLSYPYSTSSITLPQVSNPKVNASSDMAPIGGDPQLEQLKVLYQARGRKINELNETLERIRDESAKEIRLLKHELSISADTVNSNTVRLEQSRHLVSTLKNELDSRDAVIQTKDATISSLQSSKEELHKRLQFAETNIDLLNFQLADLCSSDTLSRARDQHDAVVRGIQEKRNEEVLAAQQRIDSLSLQLDDKSDELAKLFDELAHVRRNYDKQKVENAEIINRLQEALERSQKQCRQLLDAGAGADSVTLQQALRSQQMSESIVELQKEEIRELRDQIQQYELKKDASAAYESFTALNINQEFASKNSESLTSLRSKLEQEFAKERETLTNQYEERMKKLKSEFDEAAKESERAKNFYVSLSDEAKQREASLKADYNLKITELNDQIINERTKFKADFLKSEEFSVILAAESEKINIELKKAESDTSSKLLADFAKERESVVEKFEKEIETLRKENEQLANESERAKNCYVSLSNETREKENVLQQEFETEIRALKAQLHEFKEEFLRSEEFQDILTEHATRILKEKIAEESQKVINLEKEFQVEKKEVTDRLQKQIEASRREAEEAAKDSERAKNCYLSLSNEAKQKEVELKAEYENKFIQLTDQFKKEKNKIKEEFLRSDEFFQILSSETKHLRKQLELKKSRDSEEFVNFQMVIIDVMKEMKTNMVEYIVEKQHEMVGTIRQQIRTEQEEMAQRLQESYLQSLCQLLSEDLLPKVRKDIEVTSDIMNLVNTLSESFQGSDTPVQSDTGQIETREKRSRSLTRAANSHVEAAVRSLHQSFDEADDESSEYSNHFRERPSRKIPNTVVTSLPSATNSTSSDGSSLHSFKSEVSQKQALRSQQSESALRNNSFYPPSVRMYNLNRSKRDLASTTQVPDHVYDGAGDRASRGLRNTLSERHFEKYPKSSSSYVQSSFVPRSSSSPVPNRRTQGDSLTSVESCYDALPPSIPLLPKKPRPLPSSSK